jgi:hypothetical protein
MLVMTLEGTFPEMNYMLNICFHESINVMGNTDFYNIKEVAL